MSGETNEIKPAIPLKLKSLDDLVRLVVTWTLRQTPASVLYFEKNGKHYYASITTLGGYYELRGIPLILYVEDDKEPKGTFIAYTTDPKEEIKFMNSTTERMYKYIPIIRLTTPPVFFREV